jgi:general secretion pathway protein G
MRQRFQAVRHNQSGFTLIELLIVIVILGVLSGIVVFAVANFNGDGVAAACKANVKNIETASEAYYAKTGGYAGSIQALKDANYLKDVPNTGGKYTIDYAAGVVTGKIGTTDCMTM